MWVLKDSALELLIFHSTAYDIVYTYRLVQSVMRYEEGNFFPFNFLQIVLFSPIYCFVFFLSLD